MRVRIVIAATLTVFVVASPIRVRAQSAPAEHIGAETAILQRAAANIMNIEPGWRFVAGLCSCPPLMKEQVGVAIGTWELRSADTSLRRVDVTVHSIATADAASRYMRADTRKHVGAGWSIQDYDLADGGYLSIYQDGKRYEVSFRRVGS